MPLLRSPQHHHLTYYELPAHDALFLDRQLIMELYLELPAYDEPYYTWLHYSVTPVTCYISLVYKCLYIW